MTEHTGSFPQGMAQMTRSEAPDTTVALSEEDGWITVYEDGKPRRVKLDMRNVREDPGCENGKQGAASRDG